MHFVAISIALAIAVTACASVSDIVPTGKGTYMVAAKGVMGYSSEGDQKIKALVQADKYCKEQGKTMEQVSSEGTPSGFGRIASSQVEFRCK